MSQLLEEIETLLPANSTEEEPSEVSAVGPVTVAVVGRPNVGKSSFINAITQTKRAIVSELPGTTRDAIDIVYQRNGDEFVFIDTAGMRKRGSHSSSVEVFSVMRSERSIRRAKLCILMVDVTSGVTMQDKKIAGLIQEAGKAAIVILNKFDLVKPKRGVSNAIQQVVEEARQQLFFLDYAPVLVTSAVTGEHVEKLFRLIKKLQRDARARIGTGALNRHLRAAFAANPPPMVSGHRLKLFYATQAGDANEGRGIEPAKFVLFVNDPRLLSDTYRRYLERQIREIEPYAGVPIFLNCRSRSETAEL
jgi:GTP-binding protein